MDAEGKASVTRFCARARDKAGSGTKLQELLSPWYQAKNRSTVDAWANGSGDPPSWVLYTMARELDLSLDEFTIPEADHRSLREQIAELRADVQALQVQVARLLEQEGLAVEEA